MRTRTLVASTLLAGLAGCASCDSVPGDAVTDCNAHVVPGGAAVDLLVVVDDSGSMSNKQQALADNLSDFIDALTSSAIALDVRIGVTNSSIDDYNGRTGYGAAASNSGAPYPGPAGVPFPNGTIIAIDPDASGTGQFGHFTWGTAYDPSHLVSTWGGPRILSGGPNLARDFKANVHQGEWGSGKEQPLRAMRASLDAAMVTTSLNFGFLRSGAKLGVIILTDEDDCSESEATKHITSDNVCHATGGSTTPIDSPYFDSLNGFVDYLDTTIRGVTGSPPIVAVIAGFNGTNPTGCTGTAFSSSANPRRLSALLDRLKAAQPYRFSICQPFGDALAAIAQALIPQTMPLEQAPANWRMMVVSVQRPGAGVIPCHMEPAGSTAAADVVYTPPPPGGLATLSFKGPNCSLLPGDRVNIQIVCAH
jgi:hypothetical protein